MLFMLLTSAALAQNGRFDLRLRQTSADCADRTVTFALEIRASHPDSTFTIASANLRFSYPAAVLTNPELTTQDNYASGNYGLQQLVNQDGIVTLNINYIGPIAHPDTINVDTTWRSVSHVTFEVPEASTGCYTLTWQSTAFPGLEVYQLTGDPNGEELVTQGTMTSSTGCAFPKPTATISGTQNILEKEPALLKLEFTGSAPYSVTLSNGLTYTSSSNLQMIEVYPTGSTSYTISSIKDICAVGTSSGSATVWVKEPEPECKVLCVPISYKIVRN